MNWKLHPDKATLAYAERYVSEVKNLMGLRDWIIEVVVDPTPLMAHEMDDQYTAWIQPTNGQRLAHLWLSADFFAGSPEQQRATVCHELIHCHQYPEEHLIKDELPRWLRESDDVDLGYLFHRWWTEANEAAVDGIARAWARELPLPRWPRGKAKLVFAPAGLEEPISCPNCTELRLGPDLHCDRCGVTWQRHHLDWQDQSRHQHQVELQTRKRDGTAERTAATGGPRRSSART